MIQTSIGFKSKGHSLEGVLTLPRDASSKIQALIVSHPHPVIGGNMDNPVVKAICQTADEHGLATLRFNFRGVGNSEGEFSNGIGEREDLKAALNVLKHWPEMRGVSISLIGYSFGAGVILSGLRKCKEARSLVLVAPPISSVRNSYIKSDKRPKLFLVGQQDRICPSQELQGVLDGVRQPLQFSEIPCADHGLSSHENEVASRVVEFVVGALN